MVVRAETFVLTFHDQVRRPTGFAYFIHYAAESRNLENPLQLTEWKKHLSLLEDATRDGIDIEKGVAQDPRWPAIKQALIDAGAKFE